MFNAAQKWLVTGVKSGEGKISVYGCLEESVLEEKLQHQQQSAKLTCSVDDCLNSSWILLIVL